MKNDFDILTLDGVGEVLKLSRRSVYRLVKEGRLEAFNLRGPGSGLRVRRSAVNAYIRREIQRFQLEHGPVEKN